MPRTTSKPIDIPQAKPAPRKQPIKKPAVPAPKKLTPKQKNEALKQKLQSFLDEL